MLYDRVSINMIVKDKEKFIAEIKWFEELSKNSSGPYNEKLILFCDKWHLADGKVGLKEIKYTLRFIDDLFEKIGVYLTSSEYFELEEFFTNIKPNYYSIKEKIINLSHEAGLLISPISKKPKIKEAAFLFIVSDTGSILMVSRKNGKYGLPGGKVEEGETLKEACVREVQEEIGMLVEKESLQLLYSSWCSGYLCHTYGIFRDNQFMALNENKLIESGKLESSEGLEIVFKMPEEMQELSEYSHYNIGVLGSWVDYYENNMVNSK